MVTGIIGKKVGMTQLFGADGTRHPGDGDQGGALCRRAGQDAAGDGYEAVQLGLVEDRPAKVNKADRGPLQEGRRAADARAARGEGGGRASRPPKAGEQVLVSVFKDGDRVDVIGTSKGHGFQGVIKRHNFRRRGDARVDVPPRARLDRRLVLPVAGHQGHAGGRPHGRRPRHRAQPAVVKVDAREPPAAGARGHSRRRRRLRDHPQGGGGQARAEAAGREAEEGQEVARGLQSARRGPLWRTGTRPGEARNRHDARCRQRAEREGRRRSTCATRCSAAG